MRLIAKHEVWVKRDVEEHRTKVDVLSIRPQNDEDWVHLERGDTLFFTHIAYGDKPYHHLARVYPHLFTLEGE